MEGLAAREANQYNYKYSQTYLELKCQWAFELFKIILSITVLITNSIAQISDISDSANDQIPQADLFPATSIYQNVIMSIILVFAVCIPLFYFTRADIFLGTGPWQKIIFFYNVVILRW